MTKNKKHINLFTSSGCLTIDALQLYVENSIDEQNKEKIDNHLKSCNLCREAVDGFKLSGDKLMYADSVSKINKNLINQINLKLKTEDNNYPIWTSAKKVLIYFAAASIIILIGIFSYFNFFKEKEIVQHKRLLGENIVLLDTLNYFTILGNIEEINKENTSLEEGEKLVLEDEKEEYDQTDDKNNQFIISEINEDISKKYLVKNDMIIRESTPPELLEPIKFPFKVFMKKKIDSLLISTPSLMNYNLTAEFVISKEGLIENPRILSSSNSKLDSFAVKVLEHSPKWKPATINSTPVDYPVRIMISKD